MKTALLHSLIFYSLMRVCGFVKIMTRFIIRSTNSISKGQKQQVYVTRHDGTVNPQFNSGMFIFYYMSKPLTLNTKIIIMLFYFVRYTPLL